MEKLLPDVLKQLWDSVEKHHCTEEHFYRRQQVLLKQYRRTWKDALLDEDKSLKKSLLRELGAYVGCTDLAKIERRCRGSMLAAKRDWQEGVNAGDRTAVEQFYDVSQDALYELLWWHTLGWDTSPLAYITALHFAQQKGCRACLDFGAGVGSGGILFARQGLEVSLADISSSMLRFCEWRFRKRGLRAQFIDLKFQALPDNAFDLITAMDVFEHLFDPVGTVDQLWRSLKPGGFLFGRFGDEEDEDQPQHITQDFEATFARMHELRFSQVWQDEWLWGHVAFQKT